MSNPFLFTEPTVLSFSGGRTSGLMLHLTLEAHGGRLPSHVKVIFANTGAERDETLDFVERCAQQWDVPITWLEYRRWQADPGPAPGRWTCHPRKGTGAVSGLEVVNYATADRNKRPFDEVILAKKMLPNVAMRFCTQWLKIKTSWRYVRNVLGWKRYDNCIGLRYDEPRRNVKPDPKSTPGENPICPLKTAKVGLADVMAFWRKQRGGLDLVDWLALPNGQRSGWDLELLPHQGNCEFCLLKGQQKLMALMRDRPEAADWWIAKEKQFEGQTDKFEAARFRKNAPSYEQTRRMALEQTTFDFEQDGESPSCRCTD